MEIICQDVTFKAHRAIVCTQSSYFNSAFCDGFKESIEQSINLTEDTPATIERVLSFLYLREYNDNGHTVPFQPLTSLVPFIDDSDSNSPEDRSNDIETSKAVALNNIRVFVAADKFGINPLKSLATEKFSRWATANWNSYIFLETASGGHWGIISAHIFEFIDEPAILHVLSSFGCLGSLVIVELVRDERVKPLNERDVLQGFAQKLNSRRHCRHCSRELNVRMERGEYEAGIFRCAACHTRYS
ncbi:BTB/POZ protein [Penicillium canescens]|nr:BTB/POZ protein [Penicillium canescens]